MTLKRKTFIPSQTCFSCIALPSALNSYAVLYPVQAGDASGTGFFDTANRCYDKERMTSIDSDLHTFLPELIGPDEVQPKFQKLNNLKPRKNRPRKIQA